MSESEKEVLFYYCELCGHEGANRKYICSYCGTPLIYDEIYKYTQKLYQKLCM